MAKQKHIEKKVTLSYRWWSDKPMEYSDGLRKVLDAAANRQIRAWKKQGISHGELTYETEGMHFRGWFDTTIKTVR